MNPDTGELKQTVFHDWHVQAGAKMMGFGGYDMPIQYETIFSEHLATRVGAGLFDVSHMGELYVSGPGKHGTREFRTLDIRSGAFGETVYSDPVFDADRLVRHPRTGVRTPAQAVLPRGGCVPGRSRSSSWRD